MEAATKKQMHRRSMRKVMTCMNSVLTASPQKPFPCHPDPSVIPFQSRELRILYEEGVTFRGVIVDGSHTEMELCEVFVLC